MKNKILLITGATGRQGGAVVNHALKNNFTVRVITRNTVQRSVVKLRLKGVEVLQADMEDSKAVSMAMEGVYGVFSVQNFWEKGVGFHGEIRQAKNLAEAAKKEGVKHFIQSSISGCSIAEDASHIESKREVEKLIDSIILPRTFVRAVFFMENFIDPKNYKTILPILSSRLKPDTHFHMISVDDIGWFVINAFKNPDQFIGKSIDIAGDSLTIDQIRHIYQRETGRKPSSLNLPLWLLKLNKEKMVRQLHWNNQKAWDFDISEIRQVHPGLISFAQFLKNNSGFWAKK